MRGEKEKEKYQIATADTVIHLGLLEQKGVHHVPNEELKTADDSAEDGGAATNGHADGSPDKEKKSLKQKIKDKMHRNSASS